MVNLQIHFNFFCVSGTVTKFILSKPPGRRMVTSDVQIYFLKCFQAANIALYVGLFSRIIFVFFPFYTIFFFVELMKNFFHCAMSIFNVSTVLEISLIFNYEWIHITEDKVFYIFNFFHYFKLILILQKIVEASVAISALQCAVCAIIDYTLVNL